MKIRRTYRISGHRKPTAVTAYATTYVDVSVPRHELRPALVAAIDAITRRDDTEDVTGKVELRVTRHDGERTVERLRGLGKTGPEATTGIEFDAGKATEWQPGDAAAGYATGRIRDAERASRKPRVKEEPTMPHAEPTASRWAINQFEVTDLRAGLTEAITRMLGDRKNRDIYRNNIIFGRLWPDPVTAGSNEDSVAHWLQINAGVAGSATRRVLIAPRTPADAAEVIAAELESYAEQRELMQAGPTPIATPADLAGAFTDTPVGDTNPSPPREGDNAAGDKPKPAEDWSVDGEPVRDLTSGLRQGWTRMQADGGPLSIGRDGATIAIGRFWTHTDDDGESNPRETILLGFGPQGAADIGPPIELDGTAAETIARLEHRIREWVNAPDETPRAVGMHDVLNGLMAAGREHANVNLQITVTDPNDRGYRINADRKANERRIRTTLTRLGEGDGAWFRQAARIMAAGMDDSAMALSYDSEPR